ncbi:MAG TPA: class I SAM-dependent methyltransferase [Acidobacteriaceae bacterium]|nr:class I SAM-dependent methyltransferase [Acidobacteriaceae bacterium]
MSIPAAPGARPEGVASPEEVPQSIRSMFDTIAPTYDRANHLLSFGLDRFWWARAARAVQPILARPEAVVLDLCCGTGDLTLALERHRPRPSHVLKSQQEAHSSAFDPAERDRTLRNDKRVEVAPLLAADFAPKMLALARPKFAGRNIITFEADALALPFPDASLDLVTFAFGFRNLADYAAGLAELYRVLKPGGEIAILECNQPGGLVGWLYSVYFHRVLPALGGMISGTPRAYAYLPDSVERFPRPPEMKRMITAAGFTDARWTGYTFGTAGLYRAAKL